MKFYQYSKYKPFILVLFLAAAIQPLFPKDKLRLIQADRLEQITRGDISYKKLTGDVIFRKGDLDLKCDLAYWYEKDERVEFYNHIVVTQKMQKLTCERLTFFSDKDLLVAHDNPLLTDEETSIRSKSIKYYTKDEISEAEGNVFLNDNKRDVQAKFITYFSKEKKTIALKDAILNDHKKHTSLLADSLVYFNDSGDIDATQSPVLIRRDSTDKETFRVKGDSIKVFEKTGQFLSTGNVAIWQEDFTAYCQSIQYNDSTGLVRMFGEPQIISNGQVISGKQMDIYIKDDKIYSIFVNQDAKAASDSIAYLPAPDTSRTCGDRIKTHDEIMGKNMEIYFAEGKTDSIRVYGMATSYYNVLEDSIIYGINEASGDTVVMLFPRGKLSMLTVIGGTEGKFIPHETNKDVDTTIIYSADRIDYFIKKKTTDLIGKSKIQYADIKLTAGKISIRWDDNLLYANPLGTAGTDSLNDDIPTLYQRGREPFSGEKMVYNLKTQNGWIVEGKTKEQDGFYYGDNMTKVGKNIFYVNNCLYTTCSLPDTPHYYFQSKKIKLIQKDKVIARPIVLYIHNVPIIGLPFGIFPNKGGQRHSGWLMPTYGDGKTTGQFFRGLGYFWAPNDYFDVKLTTDFYDKVGTIFNYGTRYALRYEFNGSVSGSYKDDFFRDYPKRQWSLDVIHSQTISPTMRFNANGRFVSDDDYKRKVGIDRSTRLDQQLISNATLSKSWPGKPYSMSINFNQTNNLQAKTLILTPPERKGQKISYINRSLPNISLNRSQKPLISLKPGRDASQSKWFNNIYFSVGSRLMNKQDIYYESNDSLQWEQMDVKKSAVTHDVALNGSQKIFKYFSISQNLSFAEGWIFEYEKPVLDSTDRFIIEKNQIIKSYKVKEFRTRHTGNMSINGQTKLYGMFPFRVGTLQAVRHVMTPQVGFFYRPDFTKEVFGWNPHYVETWTDSSTGKIWTFDPFRSSMIGGTPSGEQKSMTFSLNNIFQAKTRKEGKENKIDSPRRIDLFSLNSSSSYNFAADSLNLAPISTSLRTQVTKALAVNLSVTHDFYANQNGGRINQWNKTVCGVPIPRLTSMNASTGFAISGKRFGRAAEIPPASGKADTLETDILLPELGNPELYSETTFKSMEGGELWSANFSFRYSLSQINPKKKSESFWASLNLKFNPTPKWSVGYRASFDLLQKKVISQDISVERDLHCWRLVFGWVPSGYGKQYSLVINIKSPTLRDIKYEERGGKLRQPGI